MWRVFCFFALFRLTLAANSSNFNEVLMGQSILYGISYLGKEWQNSSTCYAQLAEMFQGVEDKKAWALKTIDVSGRPGPGFVYGNNLWLGSHAECKDLANRKKFEISYERVKRPDATPFDFPPYPLGFFVAHYEHNNTMQLHTQMPLEFLVQLGLCAPQACTNDDLAPLLNEYFRRNYLETQKLFDLNLKLVRIRDLDKNILELLKEPKFILLIFITTLVIILAIIGTWFDVRKHNLAKNLIVGHRGELENSKQSLGNVSDVELVSNSDNSTNEKRNVFGEIIKCFSIYSNTKKLVDTKLPEDSIPIIHGIKFFGMLWVILVHAVFFQADYMENVPIAFRLSEDIFAQILSNSTYCVDTFLFLSGFLVAHLFFKANRNKNTDQKPNYLRKVSEFCMMFINRFFRLTPCYFYVILFTNVMYTYYRKTSALYSAEMNDETCSKYWWRNILYINNLFPRTEMCMSWSWYLSVDTQFFAIVTFLLILSTIAFKTSVALVFILIIANVVATALTSYNIGYIPSMDEQLRQLDAIYDFPWNRIGAYLTGVITAYILLVKLDRKLVLQRWKKIILWTIFPLVNIWILFTIYTRNVSVEFSAVYMGISRTLWGVGLGWMLIACCTGNARALEKFLAFRGWIPLSRLTYCAYLLNPVFANMIFMGTEHPLNASLASLGLATQGICMTAFVIAYLLSVLVESPSILLTKMLFNKLVGKAKHDKKQENESA